MGSSSYIFVRLVPGGLTFCVGVCGNCLFCLKTVGNQIPFGHGLNQSKSTTSQYLDEGEF